MNELAVVTRHARLAVVQRKEIVELLGFETRNKYSIETPDGQPLAWAAEQGKGVGAVLMRMFFGHWREFEIHVFDLTRNLLLRAVHPFRWFFQRLEVYSPDGRLLGALQQRFAVFSKRFDVEDANGNVTLEVRSPIWSPWTFAFKRGDRELAVIRKQWGGVLREAFTDADRFEVGFASDELGPLERAVLLAGAVFVDLMYFERKAQ